uniref:Uncharacterized protein n=1 Tax=Cannabis sativa TaxID=3483 RepID=A0A803QC81_CANSA
MRSGEHLCHEAWCIPPFSEGIPESFLAGINVPPVHLEELCFHHHLPFASQRPASAASPSSTSSSSSTKTMVPEGTLEEDLPSNQMGGNLRWRKALRDQGSRRVAKRSPIGPGRRNKEENKLSVRTFHENKRDT